MGSLSRGWWNIPKLLNKGECLGHHHLHVPSNREFTWGEITHWLYELQCVLYLTLRDSENKSHSLELFQGIWLSGIYLCISKKQLLIKYFRNKYEHNHNIYPWFQKSNWEFVLFNFFKLNILHNVIEYFTFMLKYTRDICILLWSRILKRKYH